MRYRSSSVPNPLAFRRERRDSNGVNLDTPFTLDAKFSRSMYDEVNPNFRRLRNKGSIFNNKMRSVTRSVDASGGALYDAYDTRSNSDGTKTRIHDSDHFFDGIIFQSMLRDGSINFGPIPDIDIESLHHSARIKCLGSVNKTEFDLGTFAGEWAKTKRLHLDVGQAILNLFAKRKVFVKEKKIVTKLPLFDIKGNPLLNAKGFPRYRRTTTIVPSHFEDLNISNLGNAYLVGRYGIAPLLKDLEDASKMLAKSKYPIRQTARGNSTAQNSTTSYQDVATFTSPSWKVKSTIVRTYSCRYGILYESEPYQQVLAQLGLTRPLSTLWELTPWSFVVDWFVQVGSWLDAIQPNFASRNLSAWVSTQDVLVKTLEISDFRSFKSGDFLLNCTWNEGRTEVLTFKTREPWEPTLPTRPSYGSGINQIRAIDIAALVSQIFGSRSGK